ncbi:unnamed protein product [Ilex paraguariensis]|uniref:Derlin n=1 Tax=Ilex paraguariensis TaxID=185542 RepID=A0ABC8RA50_9AQUA
MAAIPSLWSSFMGDSLVFMVVYVWGSMFPNEPVHIPRFGEVKGLYIPWCVLGLDYLLGNPVTPDILGIIVGHVYYFFAVLHPLAGGKNIFTAPLQIQLLCCLSLLVVAICVAHTYPAEIYEKYGRRLCGIQCPSNRPHMKLSMSLLLITAPLQWLLLLIFLDVP